MRIFTCCSLFLLLLLYCHQATAQRFSAGIGSGLILSQMDGDGFTGYDKLGMRLGLRGIAHISERVDFILEMNWEEKGSTFESIIDGNVSAEKNRTLALTYAEMPMMVRIFNRRRGGLFYEGGFAISYLVKDEYLREGRATDLEQFEKVSPDFNRSEWNVVLGLGYEFNRHLGVLFRTSFGFSHLYRNLEAQEGFLNRPVGSTEEPPIVQLRNYLVSVGAYYII